MIDSLTTGSAIRMEKKLSTSLFRRVKIQIKENKDNQIHKH